MITILLTVFIMLNPLILNIAFAKEQNPIYNERMALYEKTEALTQIPWYYIAAIDQYERNTQKESDEEQTISINIADDLWFGIGNSTKHMDEEIIAFFEDRKSVV